MYKSMENINVQVSIQNVKIIDKHFDVFSANVLDLVCLDLLDIYNFYANNVQTNLCSAHLNFSLLLIRGELRTIYLR